VSKPILTTPKNRPNIGQETNIEIFGHPKQPKKLKAYQQANKSTPASN